MASQDGDVNVRR